MLTCTGDTPLEGYHVTADPVTPGVTGKRFFATNVTLVIYENAETFDGKMPDTGAPPTRAGGSRRSPARVSHDTAQAQRRSSSSPRSASARR